MAARTNKPMPEAGELQFMLNDCTVRMVCAHYGVKAPTLYRWMRALGVKCPRMEGNKYRLKPECSEST